MSFILVCIIVQDMHNVTDNINGSNFDTMYE